MAECAPVEEKRCPRCGEKKALDAFYRWRGRPVSWCKACQLAKVRHRRLAGLTQARARARYAANPMERAARREKAQRWRARNPEKVAVQAATYAAIARGELVRQPCERCGERAHAHHADYTQPLAVQWLCPLHHMRQHVLEGR